MAGTEARPTKAGRSADPGAVAYYRFSNLPRSAEELRKLPGFEFENWAVLQLGEVLQHHGRRIRAPYVRPVARTLVRAGGLVRTKVRPTSAGQRAG